MQSFFYFTKHILYNKIRGITGDSMTTNNYDLTLYITLLSILIAEQLSTDELFILSAATMQLGETLETIAVQRERLTL